MFTLSCVNAVLNALVIGIFMQDKVIVLYELTGAAAAYGSKWVYLIFVAIPLLISGSLLMFDRMSGGSNDDKKTDKPDDESTSALDEILSGNSQHNDNIAMVCIWFFAIISWVMTGIALNNIENISVILPSIIVIMLSAATIFMTSLYSGSTAAFVGGVQIAWLKNDKDKSRRVNRFSMYSGMLSGMLGVCLAAWSLVISKNIPNCIAIAQLVLFSFVLPLAYSYLIKPKK